MSTPTPGLRRPLFETLRDELPWFRRPLFEPVPQDETPLALPARPQASSAPAPARPAQHAPQPSPPPPPRTLEFRSIDGSGNNLGRPTDNVAGSDFTRIGPAHFADGISALRDGPNARTISNIVVGDGDAAIPNPEGLSGMMYAWGQFIDHDLDLARGDGTTHIDVTVPNGDPVFADGSTIAMTRVITDPANGAVVNHVTGWLDASMVYGSSASVAASLRTAGGYMATSDGGNLPIAGGQFLAGDVRVQENPSLTALQTLFVREHNRQVDLLKTAHPTWSGEQLYQQARAIVTAEIANITYTEFLPHLLGRTAIAPYRGYDAKVDARITDEFAGAAYRFGHSIVSNEVEKINELGATVGPELGLVDVFFQSPADFTANGGIGGILRHLADDRSQALDARIVGDLRNFLANPPDGMDLAAINIQRGRDLGLGTLNETRVALGMKAYTKFEQITSDAATLADLKTVYGTVDKVELWIGGLAEKHASGAFVGQTFQAIIARQFTALRDGDRLWWQNQGFDAQTAAQIGKTTLADLIRLNTDTKQIQPDVFVYYDRHSGTLGGVAADTPASPQFIVGSAGADTLTGGTAADILVPAAGTPRLTGGAAADTFVFSTTGINAVITDFVPGTDRIVFSLPGVASIRDVTITSTASGAVLTAGGDSILLAGIPRSAVSSRDIDWQV